MKDKDHSKLQPKAISEAPRLPLETVIMTAELHRRASRAPNYEAESAALARLMSSMAGASSENRDEIARKQRILGVLQELVETGMHLSRADSCGISILEEEEGHEVFRWRAVAGVWSRFIGQTMPRAASPCGVVLELDSPQLMAYPERHYAYQQSDFPPIVEALLVPFHYGGKPVGTIWVIAHDETRQFDAEDLRMMISLGRFAGLAYQVLSEHQHQFAQELAVMERLHALVNSLLVCPDVQAALDEILRAIIDITAADMGNVQIVDAQTNTLRIVAHRGFRQEFLDHFRAIALEETSACGKSIKSLQRCIVEDVETDPSYEPHRLIAEAAGYRAAQSTPLLRRDGVLLGILSTHYRKPFRPSAKELRVLDLYTRQAADFLERKRAEEDLREADRRKDEFLAVLAHELRNPLAPICSGLELIKAFGNDRAQLEKIRAMMERQAQQLVTLVNDLLEISRITRGKFELRKRRVRVGEILQSALDAARPAIEAAHHQLLLELPAESLEVHADPHRLAQVLSNLLNNAAKFTPEGGRIRLTAEQTGDELTLTVSDTGIGIAPEKQNSIFDMFAQVAVPLHKGSSGLGMGLHLSKLLVAMHGGTIAVRSEGTDRGSEFRIGIPLSAGAPATDMSFSQGRSATRIKGRVLVVDDNADAADSMCLLVEGFGHETRTAYGGEEAIRIASEFLPNVILLDLGMPRVSGYEVAQRIRSQSWGRAMKLVALTGWGQDTDKKKTTDAGFNHHLVKPADSRRVEELIAEALGV